MDAIRYIVVGFALQGKRLRQNSWVSSILRILLGSEKWKAFEGLDTVSRPSGMYVLFFGII